MIRLIIGVLNAEKVSRPNPNLLRCQMTTEASVKMRQDTIVASFDIEQLPTWARTEEDVVWLARISLGYRQRVIDTYPNKEWLIRKARIYRRGFELRNPLHELTQI